MRSIVETIVIQADPGTVFLAVLKPSAIMAWWSANAAIVLAQEGGTYAVQWGNDLDDPDYITAASIINFDPPKGFSLTNYVYLVKGRTTAV
ncbi:MAG: hypothetical protein OEQ53_07605 [Saprospiraceae bacterium]|nr:hypothetical protein [Saprospiraceae bacterium]